VRSVDPSDRARRTVGRGLSSPAIVVNGQGQALPLQTMLPPTSDLTPAMRRSVSDRSLAYLLLAPTIAVLFALTIYPLIYSIKISLQGESGNWTLQNFARLFSDQFFLSAMAHTFVYAAVALTLEFLIGLGLALLLDTQIRGRGLFRALLLLPMMLPPVVVGVVWRLMLNSNFGAVNGTLKRIGVNTEALAWTASPKLAMASVIAAAAAANAIVKPAFKKWPNRTPRTSGGYTVPPNTPKPVSSAPTAADRSA